MTSKKGIESRPSRLVRYLNVQSKNAFLFKLERLVLTLRDISSAVLWLAQTNMVSDCTLYATAHHWYGVYLAVMGRFDEANAEMKQAQELDSLSPIINGNVGMVLYFARQHDQAIAHLRKAIEMDPNFGVNHFKLGQAYSQKGMYEEAIASFQKAIRVSG